MIPPAYGMDAAVTLNAFPNPVVSGQTVTLTWRTDHATGCTASGAGDWSGSKASGDGVHTQSVSPSGDTTYSITCTGGNGFSDSVNVDVLTGTQYYVSPTSCNNSNAGTSEGAPWCTITKANTTLTAGNTVWVKNGTYEEDINPTNSGNSSTGHIAYVAYPGHTPVITTQFSADGSGVTLNGKDYIIIDGFEIRDTSSHLIFMNNADNNIIRNNYLHGNYAADGTVKYAISMTNGTLNRFQYNIVETTSTGASCASGTPGNCQGFYDGFRFFQGNTQNLIENNQFGKFLHVAYSSVSPSGTPNFDNIIRNNTFQNSWHSNITAFPSNTEVFSNNLLYNGGEDYLQNPWDAASQGVRVTNSGLQMGDDGAAAFAMTGTIIRNNVLMNNGKNSYRDGVNDSHIYNNVYYSNFLWQAYDEGLHAVGISGNIHKNNVYQNGVNMVFQGVPYGDNTFENNDFLDTLEQSPGGTSSLATVESGNPSWNNNLGGIPPSFTNTSIRDFSLQSSSALIDAGTFLTVTTSSGNGTTMVVTDGGYFIDGHGIDKGDIIQTESGETARITTVSGDTLTLNRAITWTSGEGIALLYHGNSPDIGAFEFIPPPSGAPLVFLDQPSSLNTTHASTVTVLGQPSTLSTTNSGTITALGQPSTLSTTHSGTVTVLGSPTGLGTP